jgi:hypothetical protein
VLAGGEGSSSGEGAVANLLTRVKDERECRRDRFTAALRENSGEGGRDFAVAVAVAEVVIVGWADRGASTSVASSTAVSAEPSAEALLALDLEATPSISVTLSAHRDSNACHSKGCLLVNRRTTS